MSDVKKISESDLYFKTVINTQQKQLIEANRKVNDYKLEIEKLNTEIKRLRSLSPSAVNDLNKKGNKLTNEEIIALQEISKLRDASDERSLDLDEVRRMEILVKILNSKKKNEDENTIADISNEELLDFLKKAESK